MTSFAVQGDEVTIPVEVRDAGAATAMFHVGAVAAQDLIAYSGLRVAEPLHGRAMCSLAFLAYVDGDLGPYHELAVAFLVRVPGAGSTSTIGKLREMATGKIGAFIHQLPVNQAFTLEAGRSIWGFPKFLADIDLDLSAATKRCTLRADGELVLGLEIRPGVPIPARGPSLDAYSFSDGVLRRTAWSLEPKGVRGRPGGATLTLGDHPIAKELHTLGLPKRALATNTIEHVRMAFEAPEVV